MGQNTSRLGLYLPGGGSTGLITPDEPADIDKINDNMQKIDADAGAYVCTSSTRPAAPYAGKTIYETDTKNYRVWNSSTSNWDFVGGNIIPAANIPNLQDLNGTLDIASGGTGATTAAAAQDNLRIGLVPISPSTVVVAGGSAGSSVTSLGSVNFWDAANITINGVFTSAFKNYKIVFRHAYCSANNEIALNWTAAGTASSTGYYVATHRINQAGTRFPFNCGANLGSMFINSFDAGYSRYGYSVIEINNPATTDQTISVFHSFGTHYDGTGVSNYQGGSWHTAASVFDGFKLTTTLGTFNGVLQVFGHND